MRSLTCIVCPIGCSLEVDDGAGAANCGQENLSVTGNKCPRGAVYAREEIFAPKRVVTATCSITCAASSRAAQIEGSTNNSVRRVPVKTAVPCPREKIPALLEDIYKLKVALPVNAGDVLIANWSGEGIDVVATRTIKREQ